MIKMIPTRSKDSAFLMTFVLAALDERQMTLILIVSYQFVRSEKPLGLKNGKSSVRYVSPRQSAPANLPFLTN